MPALLHGQRELALSPGAAPCLMRREQRWLAHLGPRKDPGDGSQRGDIARGLAPAARVAWCGGLDGSSKGGHGHQNAAARAQQAAGALAQLRQRSESRAEGTLQRGVGTPCGARPDVQVAQLLLGGGVLEVGDEGGVLEHHAAVGCGVRGEPRREGGETGSAGTVVRRRGPTKPSQQPRWSERKGPVGWQCSGSADAPTFRVTSGRTLVLRCVCAHPGTTRRSSRPSACARRRPWRAGAAAGR